MLELNFIKLLFFSANLQIKYKDTHWFMKYWRKSEVSAFNKTIWIPSQKFEEENKALTVAMLGHEYIHFIDRQRDGYKYNLKYWCNPHHRFIYELKAYKVNILMSLHFNNQITQEQILELAKIMSSWRYMYMIKKQIAIRIIKSEVKRLNIALNETIPNKMPLALKKILYLLKECRNK